MSRRKKNQSKHWFKPRTCVPNMPIYVTSHPRSGTNLLLNYIFENFSIEGSTTEKYVWGTHYMDESLSPPDKTLCVFRDLLPVMLSLYRLRATWLIHPSVSFKDFLRTPYVKMPNTEVCDIWRIKNGKRITKSTPAHDPLKRFDITPVDYWLQFNIFWAPKAKLFLKYDDFLNNVKGSLLSIERTFDLQKRRPTFQKIKRQVGLFPKKIEDVDYDKDDEDLINEYQQKWATFVQDALTDV